MVSDGRGIINSVLKDRVALPRQKENIGLLSFLLLLLLLIKKHHCCSATDLGNSERRKVVLF